MTTFRTDTGGGNGRALDDESRIVVYEQGARRLTRVGRDGGVTVLAPGGTKLGRIRTPEPGRNIAFGDDDFRTLSITAGSGRLKPATTLDNPPVDRGHCPRVRTCVCFAPGNGGGRKGVACSDGSIAPRGMAD